MLDPVRPPLHIDDSAIAWRQFPGWRSSVAHLDVGAGRAHTDPVVWKFV
ncbi:MAG: hypothetical protein GY745_18215 [Actinomycetia bacterium]|nr:hypothetical protein [Actinomycetes bacterium]